MSPAGDAATAAAAGPRRAGRSALVEFAFVLPVLAVMAFGVIEFGLAWQDRLTVQTAVRAGVRVGSADGKLATADKEVLLGVGAVLYDLGLANVDSVVVYKSTTTDGAVPPACLTPNAPQRERVVQRLHRGPAAAASSTAPPRPRGSAAASARSTCPGARPPARASRPWATTTSGVRVIGPPSDAHRVLRIDAHASTTTPSCASSPRRPDGRPAPGCRSRWSRAGTRAATCWSCSPLSLATMVVSAAFAVDVGGWYARAAEVQRAADAAALAGVVWMPDFPTSADRRPWPPPPATGSSPAATISITARRRRPAAPASSRWRSPTPRRPGTFSRLR